MKKQISKSSKSLINISLVKLYSKYSYPIKSNNPETSIILKKLFKLKERKSSCINLSTTFNLVNFASKIKKQRDDDAIDSFGDEMFQLLNNKKFNLMTSDIYPIIYNINFLMKKIFTLMKSTTHQFEEVRRVLSKHSLDEIHSANFSITESFSVFYDLAEDLNKMNSMNYSFKVKLFLEKYTKFVENLERRVNICMSKSRNPSTMI